MSSLDPGTSSTPPAAASAAVAAHGHALDELDALLAGDVDELMSDLGAIDGILAAESAPPPTSGSVDAPPHAERAAPIDRPETPLAEEPVAPADIPPARCSPAPRTRPAREGRSLLGVLAALNAPVMRMSDTRRRVVDWIAVLLTLSMALIWLMNIV